MATISTITLTLNEESDIQRCLNSLQWADERIVIDSYSRDSTVSKAAPLCAKIMQRKMTDFSELRNFGIKQATNEWILMVDADEVISPALAKEIKQVINNSAYNGFYINRINYMYGVKLRHSQPDYILRLFRKKYAFFKNPVHETAVIEGKVGKLKNSFAHYSMKNLQEHIRKIKQYTDIEAKNCDQGYIILSIKPFFRLFQNLIIKKAIFDGIAGIIFSLNSFLYEVVKLIKVWQNRHSKRSWFDFYKKVDISQEIKQQSMIHKQFIDSILKTHAKDATADKFLDVGTGAGAISLSILKNHDIFLVTIDDKFDILRKVQEDSKRLGMHINLVCADAFKLPFKDNSFTKTFSQGLLEHFHDSDIKSLINEKLRVCSDSVLFSVPNNYYKHKDFGDERLLAKNEWESILSNYDIIESKNYYQLRTKRNFLRHLPVMYMCKLRKN